MGSGSHPCPCQLSTRRPLLRVEEYQFIPNCDVRDEPRLARKRIRAGGGVWSKVAPTPGSSAIRTLARVSTEKSASVNGKYSSRRGLKPDLVVDCVSESLFAAKISLRCLYGDVPMQKLGSVPTHLQPRGKAERKSCGGRGALTCRFQLSRHTPGPVARQPCLWAPLPKLFQSCAHDETICPK